MNKVPSSFKQKEDQPIKLMTGCEKKITMLILRKFLDNALFIDFSGGYETEAVAISFLQEYGLSLIILKVCGVRYERRKER